MWLIYVQRLQLHCLLFIGHYQSDLNNIFTGLIWIYINITLNLNIKQSKQNPCLQSVYL